MWRAIPTFLPVWLFFALIGILVGASVALVVVLSSVLTVGTLLWAAFLNAHVRTSDVGVEPKRLKDDEALRSSLSIGLVSIFFGSAAMVVAAIAVDQPPIAAIFCIAMLLSGWRLSDF